MTCLISQQHKKITTTHEKNNIELLNKVRRTKDSIQSLKENQKDFVEEN